MERDLSGRCGSCAFFIRLGTDDQGKAVGSCRLGCWPSPVVDDRSCGSFTRRDAPADTLARRVKAPRTGHRRVAEPEPEPEPMLPKEIDIDMDQDELRKVLRQVLHEELGIGNVRLGDRWRGGELVLRPGRTETQEKSVPIEVFFKKIVSVRDKLRVLEQKVNTSRLAEDEKIQIQQYITACYGSLTTFNVLFADQDDRFVGTGGKD